MKCYNITNKSAESGCTATHLHTHTIDRRLLSWSGIVNILAAFASHIPCCGMPALFGFMGLQAVGVVSSTVLARYQFVMPFLTAFLVTGAWALWVSARKVDVMQDHRHVHGASCSHDHGHEHAGRHHDHASIEGDTLARKSGRVFALNVAIGYLITAFLYVIVPPHDHHIIDIRTAGIVSSDGKTVTAAFMDDRRNFPWRVRKFVAPYAQAAGEAQMAEEKAWYQSLPVAFGNATPVNVHLYGRPQGMFGKPAGRKMNYYISADRAAPEAAALLPHGPALVIFFRDDCAPCKAEMKLLEKFRAAAKGWNVTVLDITPDKKKHDVQAGAIAAADGGEALLKHMQNSAMPALPFSAALHADGSVCAQHLGVLGLETISQWREQC